MLRDLFGIARVYKKLPPNKDFGELANNIETLADYLLDRSSGSFAREGYLKVPDRWEWKLGSDLKLLCQYARSAVANDANDLHVKRNKAGPIEFMEQLKLFKKS
jgi:hypothetical protein